MALIGLAVVAALMGVGVYALVGAGNLEQQQVAGTCALNKERQAAITAASIGEVAAFQAADRAGSLSDLAFVDANKVPVTFTDFVGKTVLFNLWATWCVPCRVEMPELDELQADLGGDDFQVVPVSLDLGSDEKPKAFYEETNLQHLPFYHDATLATLDTLKQAGIAYGLPATVIADDEGCILGWLNGPAEWASDDAEALIRAAMQ
jgi:thiol-disulfide isomerase/thioredoxin